ncbi:uncharacterized protein LOC124374674 [Homalodisca vitripennis]|uniref:uncharacterized protein LOC124374674 n=1 Tax=Homalodisca vitripennis TaxID=197043 RepID=UPI001EEA72D6|nr:uncharacterized protein LOC124374674 [Homalodisca vitripennis]
MFSRTLVTGWLVMWIGTLPWMNLEVRRDPPKCLWKLQSSLMQQEGSSTNNLYFMFLGIFPNLFQPGAKRIDVTISQDSILCSWKEISRRNESQHNCQSIPHEESQILQAM